MTKSAPFWNARDEEKDLHPFSLGVCELSDRSKIKPHIIRASAWKGAKQLGNITSQQGAMCFFFEKTKWLMRGWNVLPTQDGVIS